MKRYLCPLLTLLLLSMPLTLRAKPGPEIPKPKHSLDEALKLAKAQFEKDAKAAKVSQEKKKDWIVTRAVFLPREEKTRTEPWFWTITFTHRIDNDYQCIIHILPDAKVTSTGIMGG